VRSKDGIILPALLQIQFFDGLYLVSFTKCETFLQERAHR